MLGQRGRVVDRDDDSHSDNGSDSD
jgi:hypothetical protein